ncbi:MAG: hypothetical protein IJC99_07340 [Clostridia bacterium]|nr:hypothetical protein [Clostridia bacterium]
MKKFVRILTLALALLMLLATLAACAPAKDPDKAVEALEKAEYLVNKDTRIQPALFKVAGYDLTAVVSGTKLSDKEAVAIYYFADAENAKKALEEVKKYADEAKDDEEVDEKNWIAPTRSGKIIYFGTKGAIKAAR